MQGRGSEGAGHHWLAIVEQMDLGAQARNPIGQVLLPNACASWLLVCWGKLQVVSAETFTAQTMGSQHSALQMLWDHISHHP